MAMKSMSAAEARALWGTYEERVMAFHERLEDIMVRPLVDRLFYMVTTKYVHPRNYIKISPNYIRSKYD